GLQEKVPSRNSELAAPLLKSFILRSGLRSGSEASSRRGCRYITTDQVREANEVPMTADHAKAIADYFATMFDQESANTLKALRAVTNDVATLLSWPARSRRA